jgi:hypothetical protein
MYGIPITILVQTRKSDNEMISLKKRGKTKKVFFFLIIQLFLLFCRTVATAQLINKLLNKRLVKK